MLKRLKKTKVEPAIAIRDWSYFFSHVGLMKLFIELLHICDIVNLMQTSRRLYAFYNGAKFAQAIITMIRRDCGHQYKMAPLRFLAVRLNPKWITVNGVPTKRYTSCYSCSSQINVTKTTPMSSKLCTSCVLHSRVFYNIVSPKVMKLYRELYREDQWSRIERVLARLAADLGGNQAGETATIDSDIDYLHSQILALDLKLKDGYEIEDIINEHGKREEAQPPIDIQTDKNVKRIKVIVIDDAA